MNKKTFTVAVIFLVATLVWLGVNVYWLLTHAHCTSVFDLIVGVLFVAAGVGMVCNEFNKKKRKHLEEVNKHQIP